MGDGNNSAKFEVQTKENPMVEEMEDQIADLVAQALYAHILRKGLLKKTSMRVDTPTIGGVSSG